MKQYYKEYYKVKQGCLISYGNRNRAWIYLNKGQKWELRANATKRFPWYTLARSMVLIDVMEPDFRRYFEEVEEWKKAGVYDENLKMPSDEVIEIAMRKGVYHMNSATPEEKAEAKRWLIEHGSNTDVG